MRTIPIPVKRLAICWLLLMVVGTPLFFAFALGLFEAQSGLPASRLLARLGPAQMIGDIARTLAIASILPVLVLLLTGAFTRKP